MSRRALLWIAAGAVVAYALFAGLPRDDPASEGDPSTAPATDPAPRLVVRGTQETPPGEVAEVIGDVWGAGKRVDARVSIARISPNEKRASVFAAALDEPAGVADCTAADGYRVSAHANGSYVVRATSMDGAISVMKVTLIEAGTKERRVDLQLPAGEHTLQVRVVDAQGKPVKAEVFLRGIALTGLRYGEAIAGPKATDAEGRADFGSLNEGGARVTAQVGQLSVTTPTVAVPSEDPIDIVLPPIDRTIKARFVDEDTGAPVASGTVRLEGRTPQGTHWMHEVGFSAGAATLRAAATALTITAKAPGYADHIVHAPVGESTLTVRLTRRPRLAGRVVRADTGAPVPGVRVSYLAMWRGELRYELWEPAPTVVTGPDGAFVIDVDKWSRWMLWVRDKGFVSEGLSDASMTLNPCVIDATLAPQTDIRLRVGPAAQLHGRITRDDGSPVEGASIQVDQERLKEEPPPSSSFDLMMLYMRPTGFVTSTTTDADGRYRFTNLVPGWRWQGTAGAKELVITPEIDVTPKAGTNPPLDMTAAPAPPTKGAKNVDAAPPTKALVVLVEDASGQPLPGATVWFRAPGLGMAEASPPPIQTGPDGKVVVDAVPRAHLIAFANTPRHTSERGVRIGADEETATIVMQPGDFVTGTVHHADGTPASGAAITAKAVGGRRFSMRHAEPLDATWTPDGAFRGGPLADGRYEIEATLTLGGVAYVGADKTETGGNVRIVLQPRSKPDAESGRPGMLVVRGTNGEPLGRATLHDYSLSGGTNGWPTMWGMSNGMREMPDDDYPFWIDIVRPYWPNGRAAPFGEVRLGPYKAGKAPDELEVRLPPERTIEGRVVLPDGTPGIGRLVEAFTAPPPGLTSDQTWISSNAFADRQGSFQLRQLGDLDYDVVVRASEGMARASVRARAGAREVIITLHATVSPRIVVVDDAGRRVVGVAVTVTNGEDPAMSFRSDESVARATTDKDGVAVLTDLDPRKTYRLTCTPPRKNTALRTWFVTEWKPADREVVLQAGHPVTGQVVDAQGEPLPRVTVSIQVQNDAENPRSGRTNAKGEFQLERVPTGTHRLNLWRKGMREGAWTRTVHVPTSEPLHLVLEAGRTLDVGVGEAIPGARYVNVWLVATSDGASGSGWGTSVRSRGSARFYDLTPEVRYGVFAAVSHEGRHLAAWIPQIELEATRVPVPWKPARATTITFEGPEEALEARKTVFITEPSIGHRQRTRENTLTMQLPDGVWGLTCKARAGSTRYEGTVQVTAGETSRLVLKEVQR